MKENLPARRKQRAGRIPSGKLRPYLAPADQNTVWRNPHPNSIYTMASLALDSMHNEILAWGMRRLAKAERNDVSGQGMLIEKTDVIEWLQEMKGDIDWLIEFLETHNFDVRKADTQEMMKLAPVKKTRCAWCQEFFLPERSDAKYHSGACKQAAYRWRRDQKDLIATGEYDEDVVALVTDGITDIDQICVTLEIHDELLEAMNERYIGLINNWQVHEPGAPHFQKPRPLAEER